MKGLCCLYLLICVSTVSCLFNCNRPGMSCNGGTCNADGTCTACPTGFEGYDCSVVTANIGIGGCATVTCENGGTCHDVGGTGTCLCTDRYTGATCADKIYDLTCDVAGSQMTIVIRHPSFTGSATVEGQGADAACVQTVATPTFTDMAFTACGGTTDTTVGGNTKYERYIILRFIPDLLTTYDERITFVCGSGDTVEKTVAGDVQVTGVTTDLLPVNEGSVPVDTDVDFEVMVGGTAISASTPVNLGDDVTVTADLSTTGATNFEAIRVEVCTAGTHADSGDTGYVSKKFIDVGCEDELGAVMTQPTKSGTEISFTFKAFKFDATDKLFITATIKVCKTAADCDPTDCDGQAIGVGRKKREADSVTKVLQRSVTVKDPLLAAAETLQEFKESKACYQTWEMTATVVALAVALVIVLLICVILVVKAILSRRSRATYREDVSETASTAHFPHLPTIVSNKA